MSHRLDQLFKEKAEEANFPFKEEYKEEAASLWDRLDASKRYRRWGLVLLLLLLGLISGLVWYAVEKEGTPAASEPIAKEHQSTKKDVLKNNSSAPWSNSQQLDARKDRQGISKSEISTVTEMDDESGSTEGSSQTDMMHSPDVGSTNESTSDHALQSDPIPPAIDGIHDKNSGILSDYSQVHGSATDFERFAALQPISSRELIPLQSEVPANLVQPELREIPRELILLAGAGGIVSSNQYGSKIEASAGLPFGNSFFAGLGVDFQRIHSNDIAEYNANQVYYDLGSRSSRYDISFGPRYELSAHAWFGWTVQRHLLTAGFGAGKVLALSSDWKVQHDVIFANQGMMNFESKEKGHHWVELGEVKVQPFAELSYAFAVTPHLALDVSYRRYFNPGYEGSQPFEAELFSQSADGVTGGWSDDPNRFSVGIQYQIN